MQNTERNPISQQTATWLYGTTHGQNGYSQLLEQTNYNGSWEKYEYGSGNLLTKTISQYKGSSISDPENQHRVTVYSYASPIGSSDNLLVDTDSPRLVIEKIAGIEVSRSYTIYESESLTYDIQCVKTGVAFDDPSNLMTANYTVPSGIFKDRIQRIDNPDGTIVLHTYESNPDGGYTHTVKAGEANQNRDNIVAGTVSVSIYNKPGQRESSVVRDFMTNLAISQVTVVNRDELGRETLITYLDGTTVEKEYDCCEADAVTGRDGIKTFTKTDDLGRVSEEINNGITTRYIYDGDGNVVNTERKGKNNSDPFVSLGTSSYDELGRQLTFVNAAGNTTRYSYEYAANSSSGFEENTTIAPDESFQTSFSYPDGILRKVSGNGTYDVYYEYGTEYDSELQSNVQWMKVYQGPDNTATEWSKTYTDPLGRSYKTELADGTIISQSFYNSKGQLVRSVSGGITTMYAYNSKGEQIQTAIDMNNNNAIDYNGPDRIVESNLDYSIYGGETVRRSRSYSYENETNSSKTLKSTSYQSLTSLDSWSDVHGQISHSRSVIDGLGGKVDTVTLPDGSRSVTSSTNNLINWSKRFDNKNARIGRTDNDYDNLNRLETSTDARNGTTTVEYNNLDQVWKVTAPDPDTSVSGDIQITETLYDIMGRTREIIKPDGTKEYFTYHPTGELKKNWGSRKTPREYTYERGRMKTMKTWQDFDALSGAATTTWNYDTQRGWLTSKQYQDGNSTSYEYYSFGQLKKRTWSRGTYTTYSYTAAGQLELVDYSDTTTDISYTYLRDGRRDTVTDNMGERAFTYTNEGQLDTETIANSGNVWDGIKNDYDYDPNFRKNGLTVSKPGISNLAYTYAYDNASRLKTVTKGSLEVEYARHTNSHLIHTKTYREGIIDRMTTTQLYDKLNRLTSTETLNAASNQLKKHAYTMNLANQRTRTDLDDGTEYWEYQYDSLGQVEVAQKKTGPTTVVSGFDFNYAFDDIGNRTNDLSNSGNLIYSRNMVNQYTGITGKSGLTHDDDGNMTNDGTWAMTYNAENRLIEMSKTGETLKFYYDYMGRRWKKEVYDNGTLSETRIFTYDGWNLVAELNGSGTLLKSYMWGLDLSGSEQGAGGVGGLISMTVHTTGFEYFYVHDGNGNVSSLVNMSGANEHEYEYGPFGQVLSGDTDGANNFRHAGKYQDLETGFYRYTFRYYLAEIGRWNRKDPIGELNNLNEANRYAFVLNDSINENDILGLKLRGDHQTLRDFENSSETRRSNDARRSGGSGNTGQSTGTDKAWAVLVNWYAYGKGRYRVLDNETHLGGIRWGDYMKKNEKLRVGGGYSHGKYYINNLRARVGREIVAFIRSKKKRYRTPPRKFHAQIENGTFGKGYHILSGTAGDRGDFQFVVEMERNGSCVKYKAYYQWKDIMAPNFGYSDDVNNMKWVEKLNDWGVIDGQDYNIDIAFESEGVFEFNASNETIVSMTGYPFEKFDPKAEALRKNPSAGLFGQPRK